MPVFSLFKNAKRCRVKGTEEEKGLFLRDAWCGDISTAPASSLHIQDNLSHVPVRKRAIQMSHVPTRVLFG
jgi:hypothetical protein